MSGGHLVTRVTIEQARKIRLRKKKKVSTEQLVCRDL